MKITKYGSGAQLYRFWLKPFKATLNTAGNGLWSNAIRKIAHAKVELCVWDEELALFEENKLKFAELRVFFQKKYWDVNKHGLIYTDKQWIKDFRKALVGWGFSDSSVKTVDYTEQGMQGDNYVSTYVGLPFLKQVKDKFSL